MRGKRKSGSLCHKAKNLSTSRSVSDLLSKISVLELISLQLDYVIVKGLNEHVTCLLVKSLPGGIAWVIF